MNSSKRERIILADLAIVQSIQEIKTVQRTMPSYKDLSSFATTQLPVVAVVGRFPVPENKFSTRTGQVDQCISKLKVDIYCYLIANTDSDSELSNIMDEFWRILYLNPTRDNLVINTVLEPKENNEYWAPYIAFQITCIHKYQHDPGGI